jgi:O-antigen/teichoic acid export membrane protein
LEGLRSPSEVHVNTVSTVARNTFLGFLGQVGVKAVQLGTFVVLARMLKAEGFGDLGYVIAVQSFFQFVGDFGVEKIALKETARDPTQARRFVGAAMTLRALLSFGAAGLAAVFLFVAAPTTRLAWLGALACLTLPLSVASLYPAFYQAQLRVGRAAYLTFLQGGVTAGLLLLAVLAPLVAPAAQDLRLEIVVGAFALAPLPSLALSAWMARRELRPRLAIDRALWGHFLRQAGPLGFNTLCILVTLRADQVILRSFKGAEALGHYVAALRFLDAFAIVPTILLLSVFPLLSRFGRSAPILPVALGVTVLSEPIVRLLFGTSYLPASRPLAILIWSLVFSYAWMVTFDAVTAAGRQRVLIGISIITTGVNLTLNFLLIPRYGASGAAVATLIGSATNLPVLAALRETRPYVRAFATVSWRPMLATAALVMAALSLPRLTFLLILLPAYFSILVATGALNKKDLGLIRQALHRGA